MTLRILFFITPLFFISCSSFYGFFGEKSDFYSKSDIDILEKTTASIDFNYGYDPVVSLNYVFAFAHGEKNLKGNEAKFNGVLNGIDTTSLIQFYEKMYKLKSMTVYKMEDYEWTKDWKNYTYVNKYLLPGFDLFFTLLENQVFLRDKSYRDKVAKIKKEIDDNVEDELENYEDWKNNHGDGDE